MRMSRNRSWSTALRLIALALALSACGGTAPAPSGGAADGQPTSAAAAQTAPADTQPAGGTINGVTLPPDAAPAEQQVLIQHYDSTADFTTIDFYESVYKRGGAISDLLSEPLVRINKNFEIVPAAATEWSVDSSGLVWTFKLDPSLMWSDDTPLTADDYVATFRYAADPQHAWDFTWFFGGVIKNWDDVVGGKQPLEALGVKAVDPQTFQVETQSPAPYLPAMMLYSQVLQKKALETHGGLYNSDPATSVSSGPFVLKEWRKGDRLIYEANPKYKGKNKPYIQKIINIGAAPATGFVSYQTGEIDFVGGANLSPADNEIVAADPELTKELHPHYGDFRTYYLFFDTKNPPFDNLKVRQALSHVIDRDTLIQTIVKSSQGIPAYSFLMPGFPAANSEALKDIQAYDITKAKQLLAEAGYPDGQGFPKLTLWLRNEPPVRQALAQAIAASIKQNLGIEVEVSNKENKTFTDAMNAKPTQIQFGMVSYGFDFLDPFNMLGVWLGGGRHNWNNAKYDELVKQAAAFTGDPAERTKLFQDAERLLVEDVGGIFIYHLTVGDLYKPYLKGTELEPDKNSFAAIHWPGYANVSTLVGSLYISKDVANYNRTIP